MVAQRRSSRAQRAHQNLGPFNRTRVVPLISPPNDCVRPRPDTNSYNRAHTYHDQVPSPHVTPPDQQQHYIQPSDNPLAQLRGRSQLPDLSISFHRNTQQGGYGQTGYDRQLNPTYEAWPPMFTSLPELQIERRPGHAFNLHTDATMDTDALIASLERYGGQYRPPWSTYAPGQHQYDIGVGDTEFAQDDHTSLYRQIDEFSTDVDESLLRADPDMHDAGPSVVRDVAHGLLTQDYTNPIPAMGFSPSMPGDGGSELTGTDDASVHP